MKLLIVYFGPFDVNSAIQAFHFGNELTDLGWEVTLAGRGDPTRISAVGEPRFECISHDDLEQKVRTMPAERRRDGGRSAGRRASGCAGSPSTRRAGSGRRTRSTSRTTRSTCWNRPPGAR